MEPRRRDHPATPVLIAAMAIAVLAGAPLVFFLWDAINHLLAGQVADIAALPTLVAAVVFSVLLWVLGRSVMRVMGQDDVHVGQVSEDRAAGAGDRAPLPGTLSSPESP
jgi:membrane protein implicated in regulation of membrane protease activity